MRSPARYFRRDPDGETYRLVERTLEPPLFILGVLFVPILLGPILVDLSFKADRAMEIAGWSIWLAFAVEYLWLLYAAPSRWHMIKTHKLDLLVVIVPFLRVFRILRVVRILSAGTGAGRAWAALRRIGGRPGFQPFFITVAGVVLVGAGFALVFEHEQPGSSIGNYGDAVWWAVVTSTTVGYGDQFPVTSAGRIVAVSLMVVGIAGLSMLTASVAALFVDQDDEEEMASMRAQLDRIEGLLKDQQST